MTSIKSRWDMLCMKRQSGAAHERVDGPSTGNNGGRHVEYPTYPFSSHSVAVSEKADVPGVSACTMTPLTWTATPQRGKPTVRRVADRLIHEHG